MQVREARCRGRSQSAPCVPESLPVPFKPLLPSGSWDPQKTDGKRRKRPQMRFWLAPFPGAFQELPGR